MPVAVDHNLDVITNDCFKERKSAGFTVPVGEFEGFALRQWSNHSFHYTGGESIDMTAFRYRNGTQSILDLHGKNDNTKDG